MYCLEVQYHACIGYVGWRPSLTRRSLSAAQSSQLRSSVQWRMPLALREIRASTDCQCTPLITSSADFLFPHSEGKTYLPVCGRDESARPGSLGLKAPVPCGDRFLLLDDYLPDPYPRTNPLANGSWHSRWPTQTEALEQRGALEEERRDALQRRPETGPQNLGGFRRNLGAEKTGPETLGVMLFDLVLVSGCVSGC